MFTLHGKTDVNFNPGIHRARNAGLFHAISKFPANDTVGRTPMMPLDVLGRTRATLIQSTSTSPWPRGQASAVEIVVRSAIQLDEWVEVRINDRSGIDI
jgi:hypothetical protein